ncbi:amidohydrolase [Brevibacillus nitrificans]|uniref:Amidohydrolase n=1 Tax=Brevibacillus nitrificans TaxID=651560 RepID=A0A3M8DN14_9BACL|nr:amidohydrolase family protein [Brevibacillus nitrificans]RNB88901.1 amidohydrolase [Brevibacillus nitrificans]
MKVDMIIANSFLMTMEGKGVGMIENGAVAIKDNIIVGTGTTQEILSTHRAERLIDATDKVVMPGLINAHLHSAGALFRGMAQDMSHWMQKGLWPLAKHTQEEERVRGSLLSIMEGVKSGTTTFCDFETPMNEIVGNYVKIGARARVAEVVNELPDTIGALPVGELYPFDPATGQRKLQKNICLMEQWHEQENGRITCLFGPQAPDMMSKELLLELKELAEKYNTRLHMHVAQGDREINQMIKRYGKRPIAFLDELGYLDQRLMAVHLTEATKDEIRLLTSKGASMMYCPGAIAIIDGLVPPVMDFVEAGGTAALGTDSAAGNNSINMFNEMKFAAILNKVKRQDPKVFPAWLSLRMATVEAARAIGLDHEIGTITKGKKADIIIVNVDDPGLRPVIGDPIRNIVPNLVYGARGHEVETVIIDGRVVMEKRKLLTIDEKQSIIAAQDVVNQIAQRAHDDIVGSESDLLKMMRADYL